MLRLLCELYVAMQGPLKFVTLLSDGQRHKNWRRRVTKRGNRV